MLQKHKPKHQTPEPFYVYERNRSSDFGMSGYVDVSVNQKSFIESLSIDHSKVPCDDKKLLLSMEIFSASNLETSERAKFLSMVNALEILTNRKKHNKEINCFIDHIQIFLKENEEIDNEMKHNLSSSFENLKKE